MFTYHFMKVKLDLQKDYHSNHFLVFVFVFISIEGRLITVLNCTENMTRSTRKRSSVVSL